MIDKARERERSKGKQRMSNTGKVFTFMPLSKTIVNMLSLQKINVAECGEYKSGYTGTNYLKQGERVLVGEVEKQLPKENTDSHTRGRGRDASGALPKLAVNSSSSALCEKLVQRSKRAFMCCNVQCNKVRTSMLHFWRLTLILSSIVKRRKWAFNVKDQDDDAQTSQLEAEGFSVQ
uniref:Uncharacterized protein n=1 Tax=Sphaerodactylus townsendi TaxID=933632 RepID=A0ACB8EVJ8_9SAUR